MRTGSEWVELAGLVVMILAVGTSLALSFEMLLTQSTQIQDNFALTLRVARSAAACRGGTLTTVLRPLSCFSSLAFAFLVFALAVLGRGVLVFREVRVWTVSCIVVLALPVVLP